LEKQNLREPFYIASCKDKKHKTMQGLITDLKYTWNKPNNILARIIIVNVSIFIFLNLTFLFSPQAERFLVFHVLGLPPRALGWLYAPWTIVTYFFTQEGFMHLLFNMLNLYWFGLVLETLIKPFHLFRIYLFGGIAGGISYLLLGYFAPFLGVNPGLVLIGSSAAVFAVTLAAATLAPNYTFHLIFLGPVKIKYIALVVVLLSVFALRGTNTGGDLSHLFGAAMGYLYIKGLRSRYSFWGLFSSDRPNPKAVKAYAAYGNKKTSLPSEGKPNQEIIDAILDKISEKGYEKLSTEEKQILLRASQEDFNR
jgi:membrane associated rhomboid family serine protease